VVIDQFLTQVGVSAKLTMVVSSIGQVAEVVTMLVLGVVLKRLGWKWTMIIGVLGHAVRYGVFAYFGTPEHEALIIGIQVLHGICYAFFFAVVYIYVDAVFPADVRASAQGAANLLILGIGMVGASQLFPRLVAHYSTVTAGGAAVIDYGRLFLVPTAMAIGAILLLGLCFKPPTPRPVEAAETTEAVVA
jgi:MFS family permease